MDDNEYIQQLEQAAALPDWIARKKAYLRINLRRLDTMVQERAAIVLASKTNVANASLDGVKAAAEKTGRRRGGIRGGKKPSRQHRMFHTHSGQ